MDAVQDGSVDAIVFVSAARDKFLRGNQTFFRRIVDLTHPAEFCFAVRPSDRPLFSLMNRIATFLPEDRRGILSIRHQIIASQPGFWGFVRLYWLEHLACFLFLALAATTVIFRHRMTLRLQQERARALFFSTVSHDIRTPLNAIIGYAELLDLGIDDAAERQEALRSIQTASKTLLELINDLLDLSKLELGRMVIHPEPTDVSELTQDVASAFRITARDKRLAFLVTAENLPTLLIDPQRLRQILFNLLSNALKFTEKGHIAVRATYGDGTFRLAVEDTGTGIAPEDQAKLLVPFMQTRDGSRKGGTGLGLSICRTLAERMGGSLTLESSVGKGTVFTLALPHVPVSAVPPEAKKKAKDRPRKLPGKMLVVDDSSVNRAVAKAMFTRLGIPEIVLAVHGKDGLGKLDETVEIVLTDMWMPELDGEGFVRAIRADARFAHLPVFALTADVELLKNFEEAGFTGVLLKPMTLDKATELLHSL